MTGGTRTRLPAVAMAILLVTSGLGSVGGTAAAGSGGNPPPTADPGELAVSLTDGDGTVNATYRVDETAGTINASYAGGKADVNVSYLDSATAIQFALDNATSENDTVVLGDGEFNGTITVGSPTGVTLAGGYGRLNGSSDTGDALTVTSDGATVRNLTVVDARGTGIYTRDADDVTLRNVESLDSDRNGLVFANGTIRNVTIRGGSVGLSQRDSNGSTITDVTVRQVLNTGVVIGSANNTIRDVTVNDTTNGDGITDTGVNNTYTNVTVRNSSAEGITVGDSEVSSANATLRNVTVADNGEDGLIADRGDGVLLSNVTAVDNGEHGVRLEIPGTVQHLTATDNDGDGIKTTADADGATITDVTATRNDDGIEVSVANATVRDAVVTNNSDYGVSAIGVVNDTFDNVTITRHGRVGIRLGEGGTLVDSVVRNNTQDDSYTDPGISVEGKNATVRDVTVATNDDGIEIDGSKNVVVRETTVTNNTKRGVFLDTDSTNATLRDVTATDNGKGVFAEPRAGENLTVTGVTARNNTDVGISLAPRFGTRVVDTVTADNTNAELLARSSTSGLAPTVGTLNGTNVTVGTTTFETVELKNTSVEGGVTPPSPAGDSETVRVVGDLTRLDAGAYADVTVEYADTDALGLNESSFEIDRYDSGSGSYGSGSGIVDTAANTVTTNLTSFGQVIVLGDPEDGEGGTVVDGSSTGTLDVNGTEVVDASIDYTASRSGTATVSDLSSKPSSVPNATDAGGVDVNRVASYVDITAPEPTGGANATVEVVVDRSRIDDPHDTQVWRYVGAGSGYQPLATQVQSVTGSSVRLTFETPGFSVFVVGDPVTATAGGSGGDAGIGESILTAERSVTQRLYDGTARRATVAFDRATTGTVAVEAVGGLPAAAPEPNGRTVAAVEVSVPDDAADRSATVEVAVPRTAVENAGVEPSALRLVRFDGGDELHRLDADVLAADDETVVVAAETPGFSTFAVIAPNQPAARTTGTAPTATPAASSTPTATPASTATPTTTATAAPTDGAESTATPEPTAGDGAGFGPVIALVAFLTAAAAATARRR
ncbi:PGF-pre-PGF domain-containing protein [Haloplanus rubicundus]|uniref:PGF-pre-PGF domain-containing protein n=1 Tax=Haloplanus rubicundus TaxID=1547898 RepID=A0A345E0S4_9EURY|nr:right-handed parallel beta-helix repeat-containing protein [Haloplanus rubicundus]AXG05796.1 PGF-pre-PGF domain-containing protein [Haloplanus rubicundus]